MSSSPPLQPVSSTPISLSSSQKSEQVPLPDGVKSTTTKISNKLKRFESTEQKARGGKLPYTVLSKSEKYFISGILATIGLCSSISMPIYWVALTEIQNDFKITEEQTNLTVTAYLVLQAISPVFFSNAGDYFGRRPVILICLVGGIGANIGLAVCNAYWLIIFLRCVLAMFVAPVISINMAVVGDITTRRDRGGFAGIVSGFTLIGQAIAPFIGSVMDTAWDWRGIFWFSAAFDGFVCLIVFVLLPETKRVLVGNLGFKPKSIIHKSPFLLYLKYKGKLIDSKGDTVEEQVLTRFNPFESFLIILAPEVTMCLLPTSIIFSTWTMTSASLSTTLAQSYGYSTLKIGLCFFASGFATIFGTLVFGRFLDYRYKSQKRHYNETTPTNSINRPPFNIIQARLGFFLVPGSVVVCFTLVYGWCLDKHVNVAPILISAFLISFACMYPLSASSTMLIDLYPEKSGSATSMMNFFRCGVCAIFMSCLSKMNSAMTLGGTYTFMAGICFLGTIAFYLLIYKSSEVLLRRQKKREELGLTV